MDCVLSSYSSLVLNCTVTPLVGGTGHKLTHTGSLHSPMRTGTELSLTCASHMLLALGAALAGRLVSSGMANRLALVPLTSQ